MRFPLGWWRRLRGWWVLAAVATVGAVVSALAEVYVSTVAAALCAVGLAVAGVRSRAQPPETGGEPGEEAYEARLQLVRDTPDPEEALREVRSLRAEVATHLGPDHAIALAARLAEAGLAREVEGPRVAVRLYYELLEQADAIPAVSPVLYLDTQWNLGGTLLDVGETRSAVEVLEVAIENARLFYGRSHGGTFAIRLTHIIALDGDGRSAEALELAEQLAHDTERVLGPDHPTAADARFAVDHLTGSRP